MFPRAFSILTVSALIAGQILPAQTSNSEDRTVIRYTTREVLLDLVVRDKHHHAVTDLRPEEVEVYEDGVRQKVRVFRDVKGAEQLQLEQSAAKNDPAKAADSSQPVKALNSMRQVNFVSVVFSQIAPLNLNFAREAVLEFLKSDTLPNTYVTVYRLDRTLDLVQPYTSNKETLAKAVDSAAKGLYSKDGIGIQASVFSSANASLQAQGANVLANPGITDATAQGIQNVLLNPLPAVAIDPLFAASAASQDVTVDLNNALLTQARLATGLRFSTSLSNGMNAMDSLHELVRSQEKLPGRKIVLFLSDGVSFPVDRRDVVDHLIGFANRAGVVFYTIDTRGLSLEDPMMKSLSDLQRVGAESSSQSVSPRTAHMQDDDTQLAAASNDQLALRELAEATGGFTVANTNEISLPMQRMMEDIRSHYELAYSPTSTNYDGHFRKIEVKVTRPKVSVQTRKGYFAVPELNGEPLQPFEIIALNAINARPTPVEFPFQIALMKFRPEPQGVEYEVAFEVPVSGLKAVADPKTGKTQTRTSLVALIHDSTGEIVGKVSRDVVREVPSGDSPQPGNDRILYAEPIELPKGHYVVDTAVTDEEAGKTTVKRVSLFVDPGKNLGMSSLEVVGHLQPLAGPPNPLDPFEVESGRVVPTLADSVASNKPVDLYFVVYPAQASASSGVKATLQLFQEGKEVARKPLDLSKPAADGSIPMLVRLSPQPGQCDVLITAQQGSVVAQSGLSVKVE
jgi:VWFA-related protein